MKRVQRVQRVQRVRQVPLVRLVRRLLGACVLMAALAGAAVLEGHQPQPPKEFVPVEDVPPGEQIPAINLVAAAYGFVWLAMLGYVWSIARRLKTVESELAELESKKR